MPPVEPAMEVAFRRTMERLDPHFSFNVIEMPQRFAELAPAVKRISTYEGAHTHESRWREHGDAIGHKLANPDSIVVSYQGDGDLASIGLAASASFDRLSPALGITIGFTIVSYFLEVLGSLWPDASVLQPYSLFHYLKPNDLLSGTFDPFGPHLTADASSARPL